MADRTNRYSQILEEIFKNNFHDGIDNFYFDRDDIGRVATSLSVELPKNIGDLIYSFRYRTNLPGSISRNASPGYEWIIRPAGKGKYQFALTQKFEIIPSKFLAVTRIPDATPGIINKYALSDEQSLLAKLRYNRLIDIFTGLTCYSLQNHLRTTVPGIGQVETDELYIGIDKKGVQYVIPVEAKGGNDHIGRIQIEQDLKVCSSKYPRLVSKPIAAFFMPDNKIALFEFINSEDTLQISSERHYQLIDPDLINPEELLSYRTRPD
jgi:hypothetical protein